MSGHDERAVQVTGVRSGSGLGHFLASGNLGILASFRDVASDLEAFAAAAASAGVAWLPIALSMHHARVGPLFVPGTAPCSACYSTRLAQHRQGTGRPARTWSMRWSRTTRSAWRGTRRTSSRSRPGWL